MKREQKSIVRRSRSRGATMVEWVALIAVIVALGLPLARMLFGHLNTAGDNGGKKIENAVNGQ